MLVPEENPPDRRSELDKFAEIIEKSDSVPSVLAALCIFQGDRFRSSQAYRIAAAELARRGDTLGAISLLHTYEQAVANYRLEVLGKQLEALGEASALNLEKIKGALLSEDPYEPGMRRSLQSLASSAKDQSER